MNDFEGLLSSDYGFKPQGKSAPMAPPKPNNPTANSNFPFNFEIGGTKKPSTSSKPLFDDREIVFRPNRKSSNEDFSDLGVFSKPTGTNSTSVNLDSIFGGGGGDSGPRFSSLPVFDKPVYDDDVSSSKKGDAFYDLLGGWGRNEPMSARANGPGSKGADKGIPNFDDLLQGFGGGKSSTNRASFDASKKTSRVIDDPFVVLESTSPPAPSSSGISGEPLEEIGNLNNSGRKHVDKSASGGVFDDLDPLDGLGKSVPAFSAEMNGREKDASPLRTESRASGKHTSASGDASQKYSVRSPDRRSEKKMPMEDYHGSPENVFYMPSVSADSQRSVPNASSPGYGNASFMESNSHGHASRVSDENIGSSDDVWLTVAEIPLFTQPTAAPPPSRPPPPRPARFSRVESGSFPVSNAQKKGSENSSFTGSASYFQSPKSAPAGAMGSFASPIDELEDFAMGRNQSYVDGGCDVQSGEDNGTNSVAAASAAAMKEAMDRAEARFRHARGVRERKNAKASRTRETVQVEKEEKTAQDAQERESREHQKRLEVHQRQQREREEEERRRREEEERRRIEKEWDEKERDKRRMERERELARQAVERAAREACERAAVEARARAERAAVQKAQAERAAVQRAQAEARERAATEAKERAEKAAAEARERARSEVREKEARERAAASARENQQKNDNDLESFFGMGSHASSAPRPRASSSDPFETQFQSKPAAPGATRTSVNSSSSIRKASSSANIVDDLSSIFGGLPSAGEFQEVEGESEDRRRARLERHQRTQERAIKALAEKNARDLEAQREQAEKHRIGETLDVEIKRWAAGKEGNLRALLSTLQYVLWPECGWQPVSLTDLITGVAVKKVYRKATLCIHPDKVQQKGATLQQKYVAEKVFDLLKEAWNKFNSEELF